MRGVGPVRPCPRFAVARGAEAKRLPRAARVAALETEAAAIQTETAFAGSDAYVERWAREDQHMVRPGDQPVQVALATPSTPAAGFTGAGRGVGKAFPAHGAVFQRGVDFPFIDGHGVGACWRRWGGRSPAA